MRTKIIKKKQIIKQVQEEVNWSAYKKLYFEAYGYGALGTKERWKCFKKGVQEGTIEITPITKAVQPFTCDYYLAYSKKIDLDNNIVTRFMYPSPNNPYTNYPIKDTHTLYTIDTALTSILVVAQWNTNRGEDNEKSLPLALHPSKKYFPNWKNNKDLWVYWTNINKKF